MHYSNPRDPPYPDKPIRPQLPPRENTTSHPHPNPQNAFPQFLSNAPQTPTPGSSQHLLLHRFSLSTHALRTLANALTPNHSFRNKPNHRSPPHSPPPPSAPPKAASCVNDVRTNPQTRMLFSTKPDAKCYACCPHILSPMYANGCCESSASVHNACCSRTVSFSVSCEKSEPVAVVAAWRGWGSRCRRRGGRRRFSILRGRERWVRGRGIGGLWWVCCYASWE